MELETFVDTLSSRLCMKNMSERQAFGYLLPFHETFEAFVYIALSYLEANM